MKIPSPLIINIVGKSGCGKTALIENLILAFKAMKFEVAAIKYSCSDILDFDILGKDSCKFSRVNADITVICSPHKLVLTRHFVQLPTLKEISDKYAISDIVLAENFEAKKQYNIELAKKNHSDEIFTPESDLIMLVADSEKLHEQFADKLCIAWPTQIDEITAYLTLLMALKRRTVFIGVGHEFRGDDAFGINVIEKIKNHTKCLCINAGMSPENHLGKIIEHEPEIVVIFDTTLMDQTSPAGKLKAFLAPELSDFAFSTHATGLKMFSLYLKENTLARIIIIGAQPQSLSLLDGVSEGIKKVIGQIELLAKKAKDMSS